MTVDELYERALRDLSASERLRLASRLINDIVAGDAPDESGEWTDADLRAFTLASMRTIDERLHGEGDAGLG